MLMGIALLILMVSACQNPKSALVGEWVLDKDAFFQTLREPKVDPPAGVIAQELSEPMVNDWRFRFEPDQTLRMIVNGELHTGRYTVTKVISSTLYIKAETRPIYERSVDEALKLEPRRGEVEVNRLSFRISGDSAMLTYGDMSPLKLKRGEADVLSLRDPVRKEGD